MESDTESGSFELLSFDSDSQSSEFSVTEALCSEVNFSSKSEKTAEIDSEFDFSEVDSDQPAEPRTDPAEDTLFTKPLYKGAKLTVFDSFLLIVQFALR